MNPELFAAVYDELRRMARQTLSAEQPGQTLQPTALVHEAYLRLCQGENPRLTADRRYFFAAAARAMRQILIESARRKATLKRQGVRADLDPGLIAAPERAEDLLVLDAALEKLAVEDETVAELVQLRYFGGLTLRECAAAMDISPRTADDYWAYARAWLSKEVRNLQTDTCANPGGNTQE